nr:GH25 family lysozyme [Clostridium beijerinckii]
MIHVNIRKKLTSFILVLLTSISFGQVVNVQAATTDSTVVSSNTVSKISDEIPNPGIPENKPSELNVIYKYSTQDIVNSNDGKVNITSTIGWKKENGYWYYYKSDNTRATGWIKPDNKWYYLKYDGRMVTGWFNVNGIWYYLDQSGSMVTGWSKLNNVWHFLNGSGAMVTGLNKIDNKIYMFYSSGEMATGWYKSGDNWYYSSSSGSMATGWIKDNGTWYYLYDTGAMAKGWVNIDEKWYYLKSSGAMSTGWINSGNDTYYLDKSSGALVTNSTIDGYKIGSDGKKIGPGNPVNNNSDTLLKGIDISHYNGDIDFKRVKASGIQCVYIKATEGTTYVDNYLGISYSGAQNAGLNTGFYHFLVGTSSPETQARNFYNNIKDKQNDLKPALDIEQDGFDVMGYALRFIDEFKKLSNMDICIYTYSDFIKNNLDSRLSKYTLWEANYYKSPFNLSANSVWNSRAGHQYTDKGVIDGIYGDVDLDEFTQDILSN